MSRTRHARPPAGQEGSQIRNAAIGCADAFNRFERELERLARAIADGKAEGMSDDAAAFWVGQAAVGRADRKKAIDTIFTRLSQTGTSTQIQESGDKG